MANDLKQMTDFELSCEILKVKTSLRFTLDHFTYRQNKEYLTKLEKELKRRHEKKDN